MKIKSLISAKVCFLILILCFTTSLYADENVKMSSDIPNPTSGRLPQLGPIESATTPGAPPKTPIDMHTSLLMGLGIAMIASYAYFSKKYNTEKK